MLREFYAHFIGLSPSIVGIADCDSLFTHLKDKKIITENFSVRRFLAIQQALGPQGSDNVPWLPGLGNPAGGLTKTKNDMAPLPRLL